MFGGLISMTKKPQEEKKRRDEADFDLIERERAQSD